MLAKLATHGTRRVHKKGCQDRREGQEGLGKDQRDHPRHVDHEGQVAAHWHGHAVTHPPAREEHRHIPSPLLDDDDREDREYQQCHDQDEQPPSVQFIQEDAV